MSMTKTHQRLDKSHQHAAHVLPPVQTIGDERLMTPQKCHLDEMHALAEQLLQSAADDKANSHDLFQTGMTTHSSTHPRLAARRIRQATAEAAQRVIQTPSDHLIGWVRYRRVVLPTQKAGSLLRASMTV